MKSQISKILKKVRKQKQFFLGSKDYKKFVIIARSRTGSNLLSSLMNTHKKVETNGEIFAYLKERTCSDIWDTTFTKKDKKIKWAGFKL